MRRSSPGSASRSRGCEPTVRASRAGYDPWALSPVLFIAASDPAFSRWLPFRADPEADCLAPVVAG